MILSATQRAHRASRERYTVLRNRCALAGIPADMIRMTPNRMLATLLEDWTSLTPMLVDDASHGTDAVVLRFPVPPRLVMYPCTPGGVA